MKTKTIGYFALIGLLFLITACDPCIELRSYPYCDDNPGIILIDSSGKAVIGNSVDSSQISVIDENGLSVAFAITDSFLRMEIIDCKGPRGTLESRTVYVLNNLDTLQTLTNNYEIKEVKPACDDHPPVLERFDFQWVGGGQSDFYPPLLIPIL